MKDKIMKKLYLAIGILVVIIFPIVLNRVLLMEHKWDFIGEGTDWLSFFGSYIGVIISTVIALYILYFNKKDSDIKHNQLLEYQIYFNRYIYEKSEYEEFYNKINSINVFINNFKPIYDSDEILNSCNNKITEIKRYYEVNFKETSGKSELFVLFAESFYSLLTYLETKTLKISGVAFAISAIEKTELVELKDIYTSLKKSGISCTSKTKLTKEGLSNYLLNEMLSEYPNTIQLKNAFRSSADNLLKEKKCDLDTLLKIVIKGNKTTEKL